MTQGDWQTIWVWDDVYVYTRYGVSHQDQPELSVIALNQSSTPQQIDVPVPEFLQMLLTTPRSLNDAPNLGDGSIIVNQEQTSFNLNLPSQAAAVWVWSNE